MPENIEFWGAWLQKVLLFCCQKDLNMYNVNAAEKSAAFVLRK